MGARLIKFAFQPKENEQIEAVIKVPKEPRSAIYGIVKDHKERLVKDAVVKLFELINPPHNLKPITYTFTDEFGQFIFGPLDSEKTYVIKVWMNDIKIRHLIVEPEAEDTFELKYEEGKKNFEEEEM